MVSAGDDPCKYLTDDDRCRIYLNRPKICREYTTDECEYDDDWSFDKVFETPEQIWEYAEAVLPPRRRAVPVERADVAGSTSGRDGRAELTTTGHRG